MANDKITFDKFIIKGTFSAIVPSAPDLHVRRSYFWGTKGETEIVGGRGGRELTCKVLIHEKKFATWKKLIDWLLTLDAKIGDHGTLESVAGHDATIKQKFENCTFHGFEWQPFGGQETAGPLPDVGGGLRESPSDKGDIWFINGVLRWRQLSDG